MKNHLTNLFYPLCFKKILLIGGLLSGVWSSQAQDLSYRQDSINHFLTDCLAAIQKLDKAAEGSTGSSNYFNVYAIKHVKDWIFIVEDTSGFFSYTKLKKKDELVRNSVFFDNNLCEIIMGEHLKEPKKPKEVLMGDMTIQKYYQFTKKGASLYESVLYLEGQRRRVSDLQKVMQVITWPVEKVLKLDKIKEMKDAIEEQKKSLEEMKDQMADLKAQKEALDEMVAEYKKLEEEINAAEDGQNPSGNANSPTGDGLKPKDSLKILVDTTQIYAEIAQDIDSLFQAHILEMIQEAPLIAENSDTAQSQGEEEQQAQAQEEVLISSGEHWQHPPDSLSNEEKRAWYIKQKQILDQKIGPSNQRLTGNIYDARVQNLRTRKNELQQELKEIDTLLQQELSNKEIQKLNRQSRIIKTELEDIKKQLDGYIADQ